MREDLVPPMMAERHQPRLMSTYLCTMPGNTWTCGSCQGTSRQQPLPGTKQDKTHPPEGWAPLPEPIC